MPAGKEKLMNSKECREIYREAFGDDGEFESRLFSLCGEYCRTVSCGNNTAAMLFALPCEIISEGKGFEAYYLFAAATKKVYRKKGYMSGLIKALINEGKPVFLKPADGGLIGFYEKLGFKCFTALTGGETKITAKPKNGFAALVKEETEITDSVYTAMGINFPVPPDNLCFPFIME